MSLAGAQQKFSQARRKGRAKAGKGKLFSAIGDEAADFIGFAGEVVSPNLESWSEFEAGQKAVGIEKNDMLKPSFWDKFTKKASDVYGPDSDRVMSESLGRSYSTGELQNIGSLRQSDRTDLLAQVEATQGRSIEQIFGQAAGSGASSIPSISEKSGVAKNIGVPLGMEAGGPEFMPKSTVEGAYGTSFGLGGVGKSYKDNLKSGEFPKGEIETAFKSTAIEPLEPPASDKPIGSSEKSADGPGSATWNRGLVKKLIEVGEMKPGQKLHEYQGYTKGMDAEDYLKIANLFGYEGPQ